MKPDIVEFVTDPQLLGLKLSAAQETLLRAIYGLPLSEDQLELWRACTGRERYRGEPFSEVTVIAGARSGKDSRIAAPVVCYEALFGGHDAYHEHAVLAILLRLGQQQHCPADAGYPRLCLDYLKCRAQRVAGG